MSNFSNPLSLIDTELLKVIRAEVASAEKQGKLTKKQWGIIHDNKWMTMLAPAPYGGKQLSLPEALKIEESLAYADGSLGWVVTLCSGAAWFGGFMDNNTAVDFFNDNKVCICGSGDVGTATKKGSNYTLNGTWSYASGASDATAFTVNCKVGSSGETLSFILKKDEVKVLNNWNGFGMVSTASHSFEVKDLVVPANRAFSINKPTVDGAIYHFPFRQFAEATLAVNLTGMAFHFMELCHEIIVEKSKEGTGNNVEVAMQNFEAMYQRLSTSRQKLYYAVDMAWQVCSANREISLSVLYKVSAATLAVSKIVQDCLHTLYPLCGLRAANKDSEINRVWRDIHTACQHPILQEDPI